MLSTSKKYLVATITFVLLSLGVAAPARATDVDFFGISPWVVSAGQSVVVALHIIDCPNAPTTFDIDFRNNKTEMKLTKKNLNFTETLEDGDYIATWTYTGKKNAGVKPGYVSFEGEVSGGCMGGGYYSNDYREISTLKDPVILDYITNVSLVSDYNGLKSGWTPVASATKYEVQIAKVADDLVWLPVTKTTNNQLLISAEEFNLEYGSQYALRVRPLFKSSKGYWTSSDGWWGYTSKVQAWTSLVGDETLTEVTEFEDSADIQFNYKVENCPDSSAFLDVWTVVNEIESLNEFGLYGDSGLRLNVYANSAEFFNYNFNDTGDELVVSWQTNLDLSAETYRWGQYFAVNDGCIRDNPEAQFTNQWPPSEYSFFKIVKDGKEAPMVADNLYTTHSTETSILFKWGAPLNPDAGPFTYEIYNSNESFNTEDWVLLKTTKKRQYLLENLKPNQYATIGVIVKNSAGSSRFVMDQETTSILAKTSSTMKKKTFAAKIGKSASAISISASNLFNVKNACTVTKTGIKFKANIGACAVEYAWNDGVDDQSETVVIWSKK